MAPRCAGLFLCKVYELMVTFNDIRAELASYNPDADLQRLEQAYRFAEERHQGQKRLSGEPYIQHLLEVTFILCQLRMDLDSLITALLHDVLEDTNTSHAELADTFGAEIAALVEGVTKIGKMIFRTREERQAESFRKMLIAMARDMRVILVKLADRLHNMRTLQSQPPERRGRIAQETQDIYAPLANRLGISWIKSELEDLALKYLDPAVYNDLAANIEDTIRERNTYIEEVKKTITAKLTQSGIKGDVSGRAKHLYSIYRKMQKREVEFEQVYDLVAFRVLVESVRECYEVLGTIHAAWTPVPGRFKDYIAMPKANMYQSLHTTVVGPYGKHMEVQIRTQDMHRLAEEGIAAHWKYKEGITQTAKNRDENRFSWLRQLMEWQHELKDSHEFMDAVKVDLFPEEVYVFTPNGDVRELPANSSPVDFAYSIHTDVGNTCMGARVNGKLVPLRSTLKNGDVVEVMTAANHHPSKDWLSFVRTSKARNKIRQWVKAEQREKSIEIGRELVEKELRKYQYSLKRAMNLPAFDEAISGLGFRSADDLFASVGYGKLTRKQVVSRVLPQEELRGGPEPKTVKPTARVQGKAASAIKIQGIDDVLVHFANCCNPLPGDPIVGFVTRGRGLTVHARDCHRVLELDSERVLDVDWDTSQTTSRTVKVGIACVDRKGILADITGVITHCEANIVSANMQSTLDKRGANIFEIEVKNLDHLQKVTNELRKIKGILNVERLRS